MARVKDIMRKHVRTVTQDMSLDKIAKIMGGEIAIYMLLLSGSEPQGSSLFVVHGWLVVHVGHLVSRRLHRCDVL